MSARFRRHLLLNAFLVENTHLMRRVVSQPVLKQEQPVLEPVHQYGTILRDPQTRRFRLYHRGLVPPNSGQSGFPTFVAESQDGLNWSHPSRGLIEITGSKDNAAIFGPGSLDADGKPMAGPRGISCVSILDALQAPVPHARGRFTALYNGQGKAHAGLCLAWSEDGIHWHAFDENPVVRGKPDTFNQLMYDAPLGKYVIYTRPQYAAGPIKMPRVVARMESDDLIHWSVPRVVLDTDEADGDGCQYVPSPVFPPGRDVNAPTDCRGRNRQFYSLAVKVEHGVHIGMAWVYEILLGMMWPELVHSVDGVNWKREPLRQAFVSPRGPGFDDGAVIGAPFHPVALEVGDEHWLYMVHSNATHHGAIFGEGPVRQALHVYAIGRDRWVGYQADARQGALLTTPLEVVGFDSLSLNLQLQPGGLCEVELCTEDGGRIEHVACVMDAPQGLNEVDHALPGLLSHVPCGVGKIRLRIKLKMGKVFAFDLR